MEHSFIYGTLTDFPYPFIVRHDRHSLYSTNPEVDPQRLFKYCLFGSAVGAFIGTLINRPITCAIACPIPFIVHYLYS